jgi:hypothetical protein
MTKPSGISTGIGIAIDKNDTRRTTNVHERNRWSMSIDKAVSTFLGHSAIRYSILDIRF